MSSTDVLTQINAVITQLQRSQNDQNSARRAFEIVSSKYKAFGGMPHEVFEKLKEIMVWPIISYGAAI